MKNTILTITSLIMLLLLPVGALANGGENTTNTSFDVTPGTLSFTIGSPEIDFGKLKLQDIVKSDLPFKVNGKLGAVTVNDARGDLSGYNLSIKSDNFKTDGHTLNNGTLLLDTSGAKLEGPGKVGVEINKSGVQSIDGGTSLNLLNSPEGSGFAENILSFADNSLALNINQKDLRSSVYEATITYTLSSEPN